MVKHALWCSPVLVAGLVLAIVFGNAEGFRKISFGGPRSQSRCAARGEYCTTNEQCCDNDSGIGCMTLNGVGQCLSDRDRMIVFESPCETTDDCSEGYCCVVPPGYRRSRVRRCKPKRSEDARCHDEAIDENFFHGYMRVGKGKRHYGYGY